MLWGPERNGGASFIDEVILVSASRKRKKPWKRDAKKEVQHEDFPGGHPSYYYSRRRMLNCGVLMGSGALVLVRLQLSSVA